MAISYETTPFQFVDSQFGTETASNIKNLVPVAIDRRYHKEVQKKMFFQKAGMIGPDLYSDGNGEATAPGFPIVRKTELQTSAGDTIKVGLRKNLSFGVGTGKVGDTQLVDAEVGWDYSHLVVKIEEWRQAVRTNGGMNEQRNPFEPLAETERSLLTDWNAQVMDTGLLYAAFYGYSPNCFRVIGHTNAPPTAVEHTLIGNDENLDTARTVANLSDAAEDNLKARTFELAEVYAQENDFDPVLVDGQPFWLCLVSPRAVGFLRKDDRFYNGLLYARERGTSNPIFQYAELVFSNCIIFKYDKIRTVLAGFNPAGLTVSSQVITEAAYTGIGGGFTAGQLHQMIVLGANAVALAEGRISPGEAIRTENDYGKIIGRSTSSIWGARRTDFLASNGTTKDNQSSLKFVNTLIPV